MVGAIDTIHVFYVKGGAHKPSSNKGEQDRQTDRQTARQTARAHNHDKIAVVVLFLVEFVQYPCLPLSRCLSETTTFLSTSEDVSKAFKALTSQESPSAPCTTGERGPPGGSNDVVMAERVVTYQVL